MNDTYTQKRLRVDVIKKKGTRYSFTEHAMTASIHMTSGAEVPSAVVKIWGLPLAVIKDLTIGIFYNGEEYFSAKCQIYASDGSNAMPCVFDGYIRLSTADFNGGSQVLTIQAQIGTLGFTLKEESESVKEGQMASEYIRAKCEKIKLKFSMPDPSVDKPLKNSNFVGSPIDKIRKCAQEIGAKVLLENNTLTLLKENTAVGEKQFVISAKNGMIGYPVLTEMGVNVTTYFMPYMRNAHAFTIDSDLPYMRTKFLSLDIKHDLAANHPQQNMWRTTIQGFALSLAEELLAKAQSKK